MNKLHVITPTIGRKELANTIASIDGQEYPEVRHTIIYDGPLDSTFKDLHHLYQSETRNVVATGIKYNNWGHTPRHEAWHYVPGNPYIGYMDDDDPYINRAFWVIDKALTENCSECYPWLVYPALRAGTRFFDLPPRHSHMTSIQYFHKKFDKEGNAIRFIPTGGYSADGDWLDQMMEKYPNYLSVDGEPLVRVDHASSGSFEPILL